MPPDARLSADPHGCLLSSLKILGGFDVVFVCLVKTLARRRLGLEPWRGESFPKGGREPLPKGAGQAGLSKGSPSMASLASSGIDRLTEVLLSVSTLKSIFMSPLVVPCCRLPASVPLSDLTE